MNSSNLKGTLFWIPTLILSLLTLSLLIWLDLRPEPMLHEIAAAGDLKQLQKLVAKNPDLDALNDNGLTPLTCAVKAGQVSAAKLLLMAGADVNELSRDGSAALHYAVLQDNSRLITALLDAGADPYVKDRAGESPLCLSIQRNGRGIELFLERGVELDQVAPGKGAGCPGYLFCAAQSGCMPVLLKILPDETDINRSSSQGITALHYTIHGDHLEAAMVLIEKGADVNACGRHDWTSLHQAVRTGSVEMLHLLLENGANLEARDYNGYTPLLLAAQRGQLNAVRTLVHAGAEIDVKDDGKLGVEALARTAHQTEILEFMRTHRQGLTGRTKEPMSAF